VILVGFCKMQFFHRLESSGRVTESHLGGKPAGPTSGFAVIQDE
jgi:hypothetical protein